MVYYFILLILVYSLYLNNEILFLYQHTSYSFTHNLTKLLNEKYILKILLHLSFTNFLVL